nr:hypothetical protein [Piscirickettsia salmonis]
MRAQWWSVPIPRHATLCDADSRGFIVVAFCSAILHHWMCKIPTEVATLTSSFDPKWFLFKKRVTLSWLILPSSKSESPVAVA